MNNPRQTKTLWKARPGHARIIWVAFFFCLLPFLIFSFFSCMYKDDYLLAIYCRDHGFWGTQQIVYAHWTGRFIATFLGTLLMKTGWPEHYYFIPPILLFLFSWMALFFVLSMANRYWLKGPFAPSGLALASGVLLMVTIYVQAEISTGFYWFSSAVTYQTSFILFLLLAGVLIRRWCGVGHWRDDGLILLLIILISGCNEIAAVFLAFFLLLLIAAFYYYQKPVPVNLFVYLAILLITGSILLFTSGVMEERIRYMNPNTSMTAVLSIILFRSAAVFYYVLKVPLFWISGCALYAIGASLGSLSSVPTASYVPASAPAPALAPGKKILVPGLIAIVALVLFTLTIILMISKGALPDRALNYLIDTAAVCLSGLAFIVGRSHSRSVPAGILSSIPSIAIVIALVAGLFASEAFPEAWKNDLSGYFYRSIQSDRLQQMEAARANHQRTLVFQPYEEALQQKIHRVFPHGTFATMRLLLEEKPSFLFRGKDPDLIDPMPLYYYNLDSVTVKSPKM